MTRERNRWPVDINKIRLGTRWVFLTEYWQLLKSIVLSSWKSRNLIILWRKLHDIIPSRTIVDKIVTHGPFLFPESCGIFNFFFLLFSVLLICWKRKTTCSVKGSAGALWSVIWAEKRFFLSFYFKFLSLEIFFLNCFLAFFFFKLGYLTIIFLNYPFPRRKK